MLNLGSLRIFANGDLGAFHGLLNPLSSWSLAESCVMPVLMYGAEAWCINASLLSKLESFQSEVGKKNALRALQICSSTDFR